MATDIKNDATLSTSLISVWLTDSSGLTTDLHGSNDLTNNGVSLTTLTQGDAGDFEDTETDYLYITDGAQTGLDLTGDLAFSLWLKPESISGNHSLIEKQGSIGTNGGYLLFMYNSTNTHIQLQTSDGAGQDTFDFDLGSDITGTTKHVVVTWDASASTAEMWLNGSSLGTVTKSDTSMAGTPSNFHLGVIDGAAFKYDGILNQVCIWSKVITSTEVSDLYNSGTGIPYDGGGGAVQVHSNLGLLGVS